MSGIYAWARWAARTMDSLLFITPIAMVVGVLFAMTLLLTGGNSDDVERLLESRLVNLGMTIVAMLLWLLIESILLCTWGTTPGKALLGICVRHDDGSKLGLGKAIVRSLMLFVGGLGLGIPLVALVTMIMSYMRLTGSGSTWWDDACDTSVHHEPVGVVRVMIFVVVFLILIAGVVAMNMALV